MKKLPFYIGFIDVFGIFTIDFSGKRKLVFIALYAIP
jgi:hypothetical protein